MARRYLPEAAYDFWAEDGRDGKQGLARATMADAQKDARAWRATLPKWKRFVITVEWAINERKVLALIDRAGAVASGNLPTGY